MRICGRSHVCVDAQSAVNVGCPRIYMGGQRRQSLGRPIMWPTSRILDVHNVMAGVSRHLRWTPTILFGRPRNVMDAQQMPSWMPTKFCGRPRDIVGAHDMFVDTQRNESWAPMRDIVYAHVKRVESHVYSWAPTRKMWTSTHFGWTAATFLWASTKLVWLATENMWRPTHLAGRPQQLYGHPRDYVDAHVATSWALT